MRAIQKAVRALFTRLPDWVLLSLPFVFLIAVFIRKIVIEITLCEDCGSQLLELGKYIVGG